MFICEALETNSMYENNENMIRGDVLRTGNGFLYDIGIQTNPKCLWITQMNILIVHANTWKSTLSTKYTS